MDSGHHSHATHTTHPTHVAQSPRSVCGGTMHYHSSPMAVDRVGCGRGAEVGATSPVSISSVLMSPGSIASDHRNRQRA